MRHFCVDDSISQDSCQQTMKDEQNSKIANYLIHNDLDLSNHSQKKEEILCSNPNLQAYDGYGITPPSKIDQDSHLRYQNPKHIRGPSKHQLYRRMFIAVPDFERGTFIPNVDSRIRDGNQTHVKRACTPLSEAYYDQFSIFDKCMDHYINSGYVDAIEALDKNIGLRSRDIKQCNRTTKKN